MQLDPESLRSSVQKAGLASRTFSKEHMLKVGRLGRLIQVHLDSKVAELVSSAVRRPVLHHYCNAGTSYLTRYEVKMSAGQNSVEAWRRRHRRTSSFLCERSFYITIDAYGTSRAAIVIYVPRMLNTSTTA